jgi:hypothetical protein
VNFDIKTGEGAEFWLSVDVKFGRTALERNFDVKIRTP